MSVSPTLTRSALAHSSICGSICRGGVTRPPISVGALGSGVRTTMTHGAPPAGAAVVAAAAVAGVGDGVADGSASVAVADGVTVETAGVGVADGGVVGATTVGGRGVPATATWVGLEAPGSSAQAKPAAASSPSGSHASQERRELFTARDYRQTYQKRETRKLK